MRSRFRSFHFRSASFRPLLFRFRLLGLLFLPFLFFPALPHSCSSGAASLPFGFLAFPLPLRPVSRASLPILRTQLPVRFFSSFPASLPQLFHRCFPSTLTSGLSPHFRFLSSTSVPVLTTWPSVLSFPFFPFSPDGGSSGASFLFRPACFHAFLPIPVLGSLQFLSPVAVSLHSSYLGASAFSLSVSGRSP